MKKVLYVNGCSHSCGAEISYKGSCREQYDLDNSFGGMIAARFNLIHYNDALSGASNKYIVSNTINSVLNLLKEYKSSEIFVLIGWTGSERIPCIFEKRLYNLTANVPDISGWPKEVQENYLAWTKTVDFESSINDFILDYFNLRNFLLIHNIDYCFFNAVHCVHVPRQNYLHPIRDCNVNYELFEIIKNDERYLNYDNPKMTYTSYLVEKYDPYEGGRFYHFREAAHLEWAKLLISQIGKRRLSSK